MSTWGTGFEGQRIADLGDGTFRNPVLAGDHPDPAILKDGDDYWLTWSSFDAAPGLQILHSKDLVNWTPVAFALEHPLAVTFAVDMAKHDGRYFIYIPFIPAPWAEGFGTTPRIFVITASSMAGPWSEPVDLGIESYIDPGHVVGEDGKRYLFLSRGSRVRLTDDGLATDGPVERVYEGWRYPDDWVTEAYAMEGPKLLRHDGRFHLISAVGGTAGPPTGHMVIHAWATSIHGPWEDDPGNPIARTWSADEPWWSRGHATVVEGPAGDWWMVSHGYEHGFRTLGRQVLLEPVEWTADGRLRATAPDLGAPIRKPIELPGQRHGMPLSDPFDGPALGVQWTFHAPGPHEQDRVRLGGEGLVLAGKGSTPADGSPLTVLAGDLAYEVSVSVELEGEVEGGLLLFFNSALFLGLGIGADGMRTYNGGRTSHWREPAPRVRALELRIANDRHVVTSWYREPGGEWVRHGIRFETSGYHANTAGDLLSLRPALFAAGAGSARFRDFRYRALP